jgi:uncharacterized FlaG/YvyC family protein
MRIEPIMDGIGTIVHVPQVSNRQPEGEHSAPSPMRWPRTPKTTSTGLNEIGEPTREALQKLEQVLQQHDIRLDFSRDEKTDSIVLKMIDQTTGETLQQIPNEVSLRLAEVFGKLQGNVFNRQA